MGFWLDGLGMGSSPSLVLDLDGSSPPLLESGCLTFLLLKSSRTSPLPRLPDSPTLPPLPAPAEKRTKKAFRH